MQRIPSQDQIESLAREKGKYAPEAYFRILSAISRAAAPRKLKSNAPPQVTSEDVLRHFQEATLEDFGPMAVTVLEYFGIQSSEDISNIIEHLSETQYITVTPGEFAHFDFDTVFNEPYRPASKQRTHEQPV